MDTKTCTKCGLEKSLEEYSKRKQSRDGLNPWCKSCVSDYNATRNAKNRKKRIHRQSHRRVKYGIEPAEYKAMLVEQNNACAICKRSDEQLFVDHDHETGKPRGLLCRKCNTGLGYFGDTVVLLKRAVRYLGG